MGTWVNGRGDTLVIQADGSVVSTVSGRTGEGSLGGAFRYESDGVPYIGVSNGYTGVLRQQEIIRILLNHELYQLKMVYIIYQLILLLSSIV